jgi:hypothetical protein
MTAYFNEGVARFEFSMRDEWRLQYIFDLKVPF